MVLGIDISPHATSVILAHPDGSTQLALRSVSPREGGPSAIWMTAMNTAREVLRQAVVPADAVARAGVAFNGPVDANGVVGKAYRAVGWEGYDLHRAVREHLHIGEVVAESRVVCEALGEWKFGALRDANGTGRKDWLYVHAGNTVDGAAAAAGQLVRGHSRHAIDLGAVCIERDGVLSPSGRRGSLDAYCSNSAVIARAAGYGLRVNHATEIWSLAPTNFVAQSLCEEYETRMAQGLGIAVSLLNPACVVMGGEISLALEDKLLHPLRQGIRNYCASSPVSTLEVLPAGLGGDAAVMGAVGLAMPAAPAVPSGTVAEGA